jgi:hypothetical protein
MKKLLLTSLFLLISLTFLAQASFTATGIAVQGIVRDAENTAYKNKNITLDFEFFSKSDAGAVNDPFSAVSKQVVTDNFGVFSTIIDPTIENNAVFANQKVWLRITNKEDSRIIQESQLMHVPYAISANNGVPTGTIMPYLGTVAPAGWLMCDGSNIPDGALQKMLDNQNLESSKTPDLRGMFLRGTGNQGGDNYFIGPKLGIIQLDSQRKHDHGVGSLKVGTVGSSHTHTMNFWTDNGVKVIEGLNGNKNDGGDRRYGLDNSDGTYVETTDSVTTHTHNLTGKTDESGSSLETRPVNYGVNYIIKL